MAVTTRHEAARPPFYRSLYVQVLAAVLIGVLLGHFWPETGEQMKPLGDGFIKLIKMMIAPIIFCTVVTGIAGMEDMKKVGKTGGLALLYFEVVSSVALLIGLLLVNTLKPGVGVNANPATLDTKSIAAYAEPGKLGTTTDPPMTVTPSPPTSRCARLQTLPAPSVVDVSGFPWPRRIGAGGLWGSLGWRCRPGWF